jgi:hypothetical protein
MSIKTVSLFKEYRCVDCGEVLQNWSILEDHLSRTSHKNYDSISWMRVYEE